MNFSSPYKENTHSVIKLKKSAFLKVMFSPPARPETGSQNCRSCDECSFAFFVLWHNKKISSDIRLKLHCVLKGTSPYFHYFLTLKLRRLLEAKLFPVLERYTSQTPSCSCLPVVPRAEGSVPQHSALSWFQWRLLVLLWRRQRRWSLNLNPDFSMLKGSLDSSARWGLLTHNSW